MNSTPKKQVDPSIIVISCSGPADVGGLADRVARRLAREGVAQMVGCTGINAEMASAIQAAQNADFVLLIDGCSNNCAKKCMENKKIPVHAHLCLTDLGFVKGRTPQPEEVLARVCNAAERLLPARKQ
ncbi:MAG: putative zinc-binding protein [Puniceicoccales bacterium]|nr:putative zinc-binding protein [Puniceicoccales bacterium]